MAVLLFIFPPQPFTIHFSRSLDHRLRHFSSHRFLDRDRCGSLRSPHPTGFFTGARVF
jgi:hypothetical protein